MLPPIPDRSSALPRSTSRPRQRPLIGWLLLGCLLVSASVQADTNRLIVNLQGVRDATGNLRASLYQQEEGFRKEDKALRVLSVPAQAGNIQLVFDGLPSGRYAVMAYHDENADQKLNLRFGMFPTEGYGLSNNPKVMGPPKFADSAFDATGTETSIDIKLSY